jgi:hypothetical protein
MPPCFWICKPAFRLARLGVRVNVSENKAKFLIANPRN